MKVDPFHIAFERDVFCIQMRPARKVETFATADLALDTKVRIILAERNQPLIMVCWMRHIGSITNAMCSDRFVTLGSYSMQSPALRAPLTTIETWEMILDDKVHQRSVCKGSDVAYRFQFHKASFEFSRRPRNML